MPEPTVNASNVVVADGHAGFHHEPRVLVALRRSACFYETGVSGALPSTATPVLGVNQSFAAPLVALKRPT